MPSSSPAAFCVWRICLISHLIASADTRQPYGGRPAGSCSHLMHWIGENRKSELAVPVSEDRKTSWVSSANNRGAQPFCRIRRLVGLFGKQRKITIVYCGSPSS